MSKLNSGTHRESDVVGCPLPDVSVAPLSHQYGACWQAAAHCNLPQPLSWFPGEWQHGWQPEYRNWHPEGIVGTNGLSRHHKTISNQFVAREDQAQALHGFGYTKAVAIGHPLVYVPKPEVERLKDSLLVMPVHSIATTEHEWNFEEYADCIQEIAPQFARVVVCLSPGCIEKGYWVEAFEKRGFPVISGANFSDRNAYERMAILFSRFEFTTTNGMGSHLTYANYFESKVSIYGPWPLYRREDFNNNPFYLRCPELLESIFSSSHSERVAKNWPWFLCPPHEAVTKQEWAEFQLGKAMKKEPQELLDLFGWHEKVNGHKSPRRSITMGTKNVVKNIFTKASRGLIRLAEPARCHNEQVIANLRAAAGRSEVCYTFNNQKYTIANGPQAAREFSLYHEERGEVTNPPEAPFIDLVESDGIALEAFRNYHPERDIYYLETNSKSRGLEENIRSLKLERVLPIAAQEANPTLESAQCCQTIDWLERLTSDSKYDEIIKRAGVMRLRLCPQCQGDFFKKCKSLPRLSLLLIEYVEKTDPSINLLINELSQLGFVVATGSINFFAKAANPDLEANLTCLSAKRLGEAQRSSMYHKKGSS